MTRVNPHDLPPVPEWVDLHAVALSGRLIEEVRATFAAEDWGGLRQSHFRFLSYVPPGGISVTELAVLLGMTKQAAGQFVTQMEGTGHLETRTDPDDRRVRLVARTALGDRTVKAAVARIRRIERTWARRVGAERYEQFREVLTDIALPGGGRAG